jgi:prophage tail gpP-like protein
VKQQDRCAVIVAGITVAAWTEIEITRDLSELSGSFTLRGLDFARLAAALGQPQAAPAAVLQAGDAVQISLDGDLVLDGYVDRVSLRADAGGLMVELTGRDKAGDLVDCAAAPDGPVEYRSQTLTQIANALARPFGLTVTADADVGPPLALFGLDASETAAAALARAARQRGLLLVSDGVGGLRLTSGGQGGIPAAAALRFGENILLVDAVLSWEERYSAVWVKGQSAAAWLAYDGVQPIGPDAMPGTTAPIAATPDAAATRTARSRVALGAQAEDPEITRYRPRVLLSETQAGGATAATQAAWAVRVARSAGRTATYTVADWRAGPARELWRPNTIVTVDDPYTGLTEEMLLAGLTYQWTPAGARTGLRVIGRHALDLVAETEAPRPQLTGRAAPRRAPVVRGGASPRALDGTAYPLTAG